MDSSFRTVLVKDATIADITPDLQFAVASGASSTTYQAFPVSSPSNSSLVFSVQVPSESIVLGRDVLIQVPLTFRLPRLTGVPVGQPALKWGVNTSLAPFPFASLITTANCQINNTNVSVNLQDIFPQILQMNSREDLAYYNGMSPSLPDGDYALFADGLGANNNPLAGYNNNAYDNKLQGRGGFPVNLVVDHYNAGGARLDSSLISTAVDEYWTVTVFTLVTEPLFLSPFTWGNPMRQAMGLCGVNNMSFTFNIDSTLKRLISTTGQYMVGTSCVPGSAINGSLFASDPQLPATIKSVQTPTLLFKFLSTQPSDLIESKNVCPYSDMPRYITQSTGTLAPNTPTTIQTQNLQMNQIPSKIIVCVRKQMGQQNITNTATFLTLQAVSINLNNASGLLSSASQNDLWRMSQRNGSNQTWSQFSGTAVKVGSYDFALSGVQICDTGGSLLVLDPAFDLSLPDYITNGSLGNYNLQIALTVVNQFNEAIPVEAVVMLVNDGIMTTSQGVSSTYTGIITKQMCLDTKAMPAIPSVVDEREIGGRRARSLLNSSLVRKVHAHLGHMMKSHGGASSGGAMSGGKSKLKSLC